MVDLSTWSLSASKQVSYLTLVGFSYHLLSEWLYLEGKFVFWKPIFSKKPYWCLFIYVDIVAVWVICCYMKYDSRLQLKQPMCYLLCSMGQEFGYSLAVFSVSGSQKGASKLSAGAAFIWGSALPLSSRGVGSTPLLMDCRTEDPSFFLDFDWRLSLASCHLGLPDVPSCFSPRDTLLTREPSSKTGYSLR